MPIIMPALGNGNRNTMLALVEMYGLLNNSVPCNSITDSPILRALRIVVRKHRVSCRLQKLKS